MDLLIGREQERRPIETKSITLVQNGIALFPDVPTEHGRRHVRTLVTALHEGFRAAIAFVVQREDALLFRPFDEVDPPFGQELGLAAAAGLAVWAYRCQVGSEGVRITAGVEVDIHFFRALLGGV